MAGRWVVLLLGSFLLSPVLTAAAIRLQRLDVSKLPEIEIYFTVVMEKGDSLLGLVAPDFSVQVDGVPQKIERLTSAMENGRSLAVALLVDGSGSMRPHLEQARKAAAAFISHVSRGDLVAIFSCNESLSLHQDFSTDRDSTQGALAGIRARKNTAIFDAIQEIIGLFKNVPAQRRALVVLSDGRDNRSRSSAAENIQLAKDAGLSLFAIGLGPGSDDRSLRLLAAETGGEFFKAAQAEDLLALYRKIAEHLRNQYILNFVLTFAGDGRWHDLQIAYLAPGGAPQSLQRKFLAATSPTMVPSAIASLQSRVQRKQQYWQALPGALLGLLAGMLLLVALKLRRPSAPFFSWLGLAMVGALALLGAVIAVLISLYSLKF